MLHRREKAHMRFGPLEIQRCVDLPEEVDPMTPRRLLIAAACLMPFSAVAAPLTITTVENPPLSYMDPNTHEVAGTVTEVVKQVLAKAGVEYRSSSKPNIVV
jgi:hypothetical protein